MKDELQDLQQQYKSVNEELKSLKSNVDNGKETKDTPSGIPGSKGKETNKEPPKKKNSTSDTDEDDFIDEKRETQKQKGDAKAKGSKRGKASPKISVKPRASTVSKGEEKCSSDAKEDLPAPKVKLNSSCDLNPCCLTYPLNTLHRVKS